MYVNIDINSACTPFLTRLASQPSVTEEHLYPFVDTYRDTHVTDLLFNNFCQYSVTDSEVFDDYADKYWQAEENGVPVDYTQRNLGLYVINKTYGIDPYVVWIRRCKEIGLRPWISVRMNDAHCPYDETCFLRSDFFYEARRNGWMLGAQYGYFQNCFDYKYPEVRQKMLDYIREQVLRYDVHGLELDFMREIYCFDYINDDQETCCAIMNAFMAQVKDIVREAEAKFGHPIRIAARLSRDIDQNRIYGFDARAWAKDGLVDLIVPSPRWEASDSGIPVDVWKRELPNVEISACIETLVSGNCFGTDSVHVNEAIARGLAAGYLGNGADSIYLYNYFNDPGQPAEAKGDSSRTTVNLQCHYRNEAVWREIGTLEEILALPRRYPVLHQNLDSCPEGCKPWKPLPMVLTEEPQSIRILTGPLTAGQTVDLLLGYQGNDIDRICIACNGIPCHTLTPVELPEPREVFAPDVRCYRCAVAIPDDKAAQTIALQGIGTITWLELDAQ